MPSAYNWLSAWQPAVPISIYFTWFQMPLGGGGGGVSLASEMTRWGGSFSSGYFSFATQGLPTALVNCPIGQQGFAEALHPASITNFGTRTNSRFEGWPLSLRPQALVGGADVALDPDRQWLGDASLSPVRVASMYGTFTGYLSVKTLADRYSIGQLVVNAPDDRHGIILCGALTNSSIDPPWLFFSASGARSPMAGGGFGSSVAQHSFSTTVLPEMCTLLELDYRTSPTDRTVLASVLVLGDISLGNGRASVHCDEAAQQYCFSGSARSTLLAYTLPINLSADITKEQCSNNHAASTAIQITYLSAAFAACSGIHNTSPTALRSQQGAFDWASITPMSFYSQVSVTTNEKNSSFQYPSYFRPHLPRVFGLGSAGTPFQHKEHYENNSPASYHKEDVSGGEALLANDPITLATLAAESNGRPYGLFALNGVTVPVVKQDAQDHFVCDGKTITGTTVRFEPWASDFVYSGPPDVETNIPSNSIVAAGRNPQPIFAPIIETTFPGVQVFSASTSPTPADDSKIYWVQIGGGDRISLHVVDKQSQGVIGNANRRVYNEYRYTPMRRSQEFRDTHYANSAWDEPGFMAGAVSAVFTTIFTQRSDITGQSLAFASEQDPPLSYEETFSGAIPERVTNRYPVDNRVQLNAFAGSGLLGPSGLFCPSLAGKSFSCVASDEGGVPFSAGTFRYQGTGGQHSVTLTQAGQGEILFKEYDLPLPVLAEGQTQVSATLTSGWRPYDVSASHQIDFETTYVDVFVQWMIGLQEGGDYTLTPSNLAGFPVDNPRGQVGSSLFVKTDQLDTVKPALAARVWARATGKVSVLSDWEFPEITGISGHYPTKAAAYNSGQGEDAFAGQFAGSTFPIDEVTFFSNSQQRRDGSYATNADVALRYLGFFRFNGAQTQSLLAGQEVTATRWAEFEHDDPKASFPQTASWHNDTFGTYKLTFRLDFASAPPPPA